MIKYLGLTVTLFLATSCNFKEKQISSPVTPFEKGIVSEEIYKRLDTIKKPNSFMALAAENSFKTLLSSIEDKSGVIVFSDEKTGYVHFELPGKETKELLSGDFIKKLMMDRPTDHVIYNANDNKVSPYESIGDALAPAEMMNADKLINEFETRYGEKLNGENATIIVVDTGVDISRTDAFQDRIIGLRSLRENGAIILTEARITTDQESGAEYLEATIAEKSVRIKRTKRLSEDRTYYLGYFSEKQFFNNSRTMNYDFNQDSKDTGLYPTVVFKNENGLFEAYINVNDVNIYGELGDESIEDENKLIDFNYAAENIRDRFVVNESNPLKSYYKYTTRMDIIEGENRLTKDRTKGLMNLAVTMEAGYELSKDGDSLKAITPNDAPQALFKIGLTGFDIGSHGTHVAGIAAGNYQTARQFSSAATKAKIVAISHVSGGKSATMAEFFDFIHKAVNRYKNPIFNFSFGSNFPENDLQNEYALVYDKIIQAYDTIFIKSAGNEGPGINSHGVVISKYMLSTANYFSTNSRNAHSNSTYPLDKFFLEPSSSHGPMYDGALKPDIGAPGWVMASVPMAAPLGDKGHSFQYFSGTSMASPNAASVVALLYDAAIKSRLYEQSKNSVISADKVRLAIQNSALPYDTYDYAICKTGGGTSFCEPELTTHTFKWHEGGAGRVNALGAWNILKTINTETPKFYVTTTKSTFDEYTKEAHGYYAIDEIGTPIQNSIDFKIQFDGPSTLTNIAEAIDYVIKVPDNVDWVSFSPTTLQKEKRISIVRPDQTTVTVFLNREKLLKNGFVKPGVHSAVLKGYRIDRVNSKLFDFTFPVTIIGLDTHFDRHTERGIFSANGFLPAGMTQPLYIPVLRKHAAVIVDLHVSEATPGIIQLSVYKKGQKISTKKLGLETPYAISTPEYGPGRNRAQLIFEAQEPGMYEVRLHSYEWVSYTFNSTIGSFFNVTASQLSMSIEDALMTKGELGSQVTLHNVKNHGMGFKATAKVVSDKVRKDDYISVKHEDKTILPIEITEGERGVEITTKYLGTLKEMDLDIELYTPQGQKVGQSGSPTSDEKITAELAPGKYFLVAIGFKIPGDEAKFKLSISKLLKETNILSSSLMNSATQKEFSGKFFNEYSNHSLLTTSFKNPKLDPAYVEDGYKPITTVIVTGKYGNKEILVYKKDLK